MRVTLSYAGISFLILRPRVSLVAHHRKPPLDHRSSQALLTDHTHTLDTHAVLRVRSPSVLPPRINIGAAYLSGATESADGPTSPARIGLRCARWCSGTGSTFEAGQKLLGDLGS